LQAEKAASRQQKAVSGLQTDRAGNALDDQPALAGDQRVALDAFVGAELDGPSPRAVEATSHILGRSFGGGEWCQRVGGAPSAGPQHGLVALRLRDLTYLHVYIGPTYLEDVDQS
jgi:hypothetical protein